MITAIIIIIIKRRQHRHRLQQLWRRRQRQRSDQNRLHLQRKLYDPNTKPFLTVDTDSRKKDAMLLTIVQCKSIVLSSCSYETSDGQTRDEVGYFRVDDQLRKILTVRGSYSYFGDEGKQYIVRYTADENGYRQEEGLPAPDVQASLQPHIIASLTG